MQFETVGTAIGGIPAPMNETVFTYSDGTTQTVDVVGELTKANCTVPSGAELTGVKIGKHVTTIGDNAFYYRPSLTSVTISNGVITIGRQAFYGCRSLTSVNIPNSVTTIKHSAFTGCTSLTSVDIPSSVTTIGDGAFYGCFSLSSINVAPDNHNYKDIEGVLFSKDGKTIMQYLCKKTGVYAIPNGVTTIGNYAFYSCALTSVTIPSSVKTIKYCAFMNCTSLTSVNIPSDVTTIGDLAFSSVPHIIYNGTATGGESNWGAVKMTKT